MANEKRLDLIDRGAALEKLCEYCIVGIEGKCPEGGCAEFQHISQLAAVDAVEVADMKEFAEDVAYQFGYYCQTALWMHWVRNANDGIRGDGNA